MAKIGKISVIPKDYSGAFPTMEKSLRERGMSRAPGTVRMLFPSKELNGRYRTGLDENASYIMKIENVEDRKIEQERVKKLRKELEEKTGLDLSPTSSYYSYIRKRGEEAAIKVLPVSLQDGDNLFNLDDPWQMITYSWLRVDPRIASSLAAYERGDYSHETQYYINDEEVESTVQYRKKKTANDAIIKFDSWSLDKRKKVARLLDLPVSDDTREEMVYNMVDNFLKAQQVSTGVHKGADPIRVFSSYANLKDDLLYVKDIVEQAFRNNLYKEKKGGRVYEGELEIFKSKEELVEHLLDSDNQEDLLGLEQKLKIKKLAAV